MVGPSSQRTVATNVRFAQAEAAPPWDKRGNFKERKTATEEGDCVQNLDQMLRNQAKMSGPKLQDAQKTPN